MSKKLCKAVAVVLAVLVLGIAVSNAVWPRPGIIYPRAGTIIGVEYDNDLYIIEDGAGLIWIWDGVDDLECGEHVAMLMWNRLTPWTIFDDIILRIA